VGIEQAYPRLIGVPPTIRAAAWAAVLSGAPSTLHALATGRDPLEATLAAGSVLLPGETRRTRLLAAAIPVHLALSLGWAIALDRAGVRGAGRGALAGLAMGAVDLTLAARVLPRIRALPLVPQLADHAAYGAVAGHVLARAERA
jgi:hypothetical protein